MVKSTSSIASSSDLKNAVLTKAQFEALAAERRKNRAGSGFDEFGKHYSPLSNVNDGITTHDTGDISWVNLFTMGRTITGNGIGTSETEFPYLNVYGVTHYLDKIGTADVTTGAYIKLPEAPNVIHADTSNSGMVLNGRNMVDTSNWISSFGANLSTSNGRLVVTNTTNYGKGYQAIATEIGVEYIIEVNFNFLTTGLIEIKISSDSNVDVGDLFDENIYQTSQNSDYRQIKITATTTLTYISLQVNNLGVDPLCSVEYYNIFMCPSYEISRSDLVLIESWHEDISEKDIVYPYGNVQYLGGNTDNLSGITSGTFAGKDTYSLFGQWQTPDALIGKGYLWNNLSDADKIKFVSNPKNNCYQDNDKIIQVRYRFRVVQGIADNWKVTDSQINSTWFTLRATDNHIVQIQGKKPKPAWDLDLYSNTSQTYGSYFNTSLGMQEANDFGLFRGRYINPTYADGNIFAIPIALVHRRNKGAYHPKFNPNGCSNWRNAIDTANLSWFHADIYKNIQSISQAFTISGTGFVRSSGTYQGSIVSAFSNRPDGLYYDQIHSSDIIDLRNSSDKITDLKRLLEKEVNRAIAGELRGIEGEWKFHGFLDAEHTVNGAFGYTTTNRAGTTYVNIGTTVLNQYDIPNNDLEARLLFLGDNGNSYILQRKGESSSPYIFWGYTDNLTYLYNFGTEADTVNLTALFPIGTTLKIGFITRSSNSKSDITWHCDIIGNPTNYYRGQTHTDTGVSKVIELNIGDVIWNRDGNDINGLNGHFYKSIVYVASHDLLNSDYTNATYWVDLGTEWDGPGSWRTGTLGNPLILGENGEDYIPDASGKDIKLSKKVNGTTVYQLKSLDYGVTWSSSPTYAVGTTDNRLANQTLNIPGHELWMVFYKTNSNLTEPVINNEILEINDVNIITSNNVQYGNTLMESLIHKVGIDALNESRKIELTKYSLLDTNKLYSALPPFTATGESNPSGTNNPAIKVLPYLTEANNKLFLQFLFKEMKYEVTWGDSDTFNIVDNISTTTDDNGNSILIGQKRIELPYFIRKDD